METGDLIATTGLDEQVVRAAVDRLAELGTIVNGEGGAIVGPNDWDVRGAR
jgi:DNA-binding transcriptional regulator PaaX